MEEKIKEENVVEKTYKIICNLLRIFIVISIIIFLVKGVYNKVLFMCLAFVFTFFDYFIKKLLKMELSVPLKLSLLSLILSAQCLGSGYDFYDMFNWWDTVVHGISGIIFFFVGFELLNELNTKFLKGNIHPFVQICFSIGFSMAVIVLWEIFEFTWDKAFNQNMQITRGLCGQDAIWDTMEDMIAASIGTILATVTQSFRFINVRNEKIENEKK